MVQNGEPLDLLLGTDVLSKLGCSVMALQDGGKGASVRVHPRTSFIPATVGHSELKTVAPITSQLCAKNVSTEKSVVPSTS